MDDRDRSAADAGCQAVRTWRTTMRSALLRQFVVTLLALGTVIPQCRGQDLEKKADGANPPPAQGSDRVRPAESEPDFMVWKQKAQVELEVLRAQVEAKKAEILLREAEYRAKQLAPDLAILTKLEEPIAMSFANETPLEDVLKYIKAATQRANDNGIAIYVDPEGLAKMNKTMSSPVSLDVEGVPLRTTLRLLLKQLGLVYTVKDGLLTISAHANN
jgi:hypothetical protein